MWYCSPNGASTIRDDWYNVLRGLCLKTSIRPSVMCRKNLLSSDKWIRHQLLRFQWRRAVHQVNRTLKTMETFCVVVWREKIYSITNVKTLKVNSPYLSHRTVHYPLYLRLQGVVRDCKILTKFYLNRHTLHEKYGHPECWHQVKSWPDCTYSGTFWPDISRIRINCFNKFGLSVDNTKP